ncbi:VirB4-like conjugal transfer ATPase, CD1110 family [Ohessyouella blattaphilus]|uniref:VirB4-like conjugal transfer ATPase, CD1110 family n=1 Tax=Ohessyouella blattaphilus TaxID=2949333 RepID=UPI003EBDD8AA
MQKGLTEKIYKIPKSVQETIPVHKVSENGVFQIEKQKSKNQDVTFDKAYIFSDMNFSIKDESEKEEHFMSYCKMLNSLNVSAKIIIANHNINKEEFEKTVLIESKPGYEDIITAYNSLTERRMKEGRNDIQQVRYLILTCKKKDFANANAYFRTIESGLMTQFRALESKLIPLNAMERMRVLHRIYRLGKETEFTVDEKNLTKKTTWKNDICNLYIKEKRDYMTFEDRYCTVLFAKNYPSSLSDDFLNELTSVPFHTVTTLDIAPIPKELVSEKLMQAYMNNERQIQAQQEYRNKHQAFSSEITYEKRKEKEEIEEYMDEVRSNDQRMFFLGLLVMVTGTDKQDLESKVDTIKTIGASANMQLETYCGRQVRAMNTCLPLGSREVNIMRSIFTQPLACLMPFNVQELFDEKGMCYGVNQVSKNMLLGDRKKLLNGNGFIFGVSGSGKSVNAKSEMGQVITKTEDDVIVIDPQNEYFEITNNLGGQVIDLSSQSRDYMNPLDVPDRATITDISNFIADKTEFMLGICAKALYPDPITATHRSIIDRCVRSIYGYLSHENTQEHETPTFVQFREALSDVAEPEARELYIALETFTDGSLNIFSHQSNVNVNNRFITYGIANLGNDLKALALLIMIENVCNKIASNSKAGKATWVYVDECHVITDDDYGNKALEKLWKEVRKQGGIMTGITQNVADCLINKRTKNMIANSEFLLLNNQNGIDRDLLTQIIEISGEQTQYIINAESGTGILKFGSSMIPFDNEIPKDNLLYDLYNTNLHEKFESRKGATIA